MANNWQNESAVMDDFELLCYHDSWRVVRSSIATVERMIQMCGIPARLTVRNALVAVLWDAELAVSMGAMG